jgi:hypothetical protein
LSTLPIFPFVKTTPLGVDTLPPPLNFSLNMIKYML